MMYFAFQITSAILLAILNATPNRPPKWLQLVDKLDVVLG